MKTKKPIIYILPGAVAFVLLLAVNATALTKSAPAAKASPAQTTLTPAAPAASPASSAGEDIRDIRQPRHLATPWFWILVGAGVVTLLGALVFWRLSRAVPVRARSPQAQALARLAEARLFMDPEHAREYCFAVSQIIRGYVEDQLRLRAPRLTTEEFLRELVEVPGKINAAQRELLGDFLQHCDLAKFAGWRYSLAALAAMHDSAIEFVQQSSVVAPPAIVTPAPETPAANQAHALVSTAKNNL